MSSLVTCHIAHDMSSFMTQHDISHRLQKKSPPIIHPSRHAIAHAIAHDMSRLISCHIVPGTVVSLNPLDTRVHNFRVTCHGSQVTSHKSQESRAMSHVSRVVAASPITRQKILNLHRFRRALLRLSPLFSPHTLGTRLPASLG